MFVGEDDGLHAIAEAELHQYAGRVARMSDQAWAERPVRSVTTRLNAPKIAVESAA